ncbi:MAG: ABC-F family ATP-binding cassette domain-containing protein [Escherichia coli]|nr:ABC-F family ATP-binding cassette domain-containing protein [Escherichia coli]
MISVEGLKVEFGVKPLFHDVSFVINDRDRIALVGKNGAGKSTMLKILCGLQKPTDGVVAIPNETTIGYLPQVMKLQDDTTVKEETRKAFAHNTEMKARLDKMQQEMADRTDYESESYAQLVEKFTQEHERYMMMGGENYEAEIERTLSGLGFTREDFERPTREFSGGWRMRIELAKILLQKPDVLLLDEPTNHLDIESIQWLEQFLAQSAKAVVLVSHDRAFINNVTNRTLEITCGRVEDYRVKYDEYIVLRAERREQQLRAYENQQKEIADIKDFIERFRYKPTKAVQVQSRIKQLEKIVPIEVDEVDNKQMHLKFPPCLRSGDYPVICDEVRKDYGSHTVFDHVNLTIKRGEKVAFVGKNGEGKSTLVKCIMGEIPFTGNLKIGHNVQIGYFAQNQAQLLDENLTIFQTIDNVATGEMRLKVNDLLGAFMFGGETSEKYVKVLSGGERSRLAMIKLLLEPVNLLILDEPTNHLDMQSKDVLKEAIKAFDGTAIIVSHDREFLDGLVDKVYEFGGGKVREHLGGIYDYLRAHNAESINQALANQGGKGMASAGSPSGSSSSSSSGSSSSGSSSSGSSSSSASSSASSSDASSGKISYAEHKEQQKKIRKAEKAVKECEAKIEKLEARKAEIDALLMKPENATNMELVTEYTNLMKTLDEENDRWMILSEELEEVKNS